MVTLGVRCARERALRMDVAFLVVSESLKEWTSMELGKTGGLDLE